jgi:hypothetical protein
MNTQFLQARAAACLLLAMAGAHAQQAAQAAAADPQAAVPATRYQPTLPARLEPAAEGSPDRNWVASNQKVAATNSMALTMKTGMAAMAGMGGMDTAKPSEAPAMCTPPAAGGQGMQCKMACCASCPCMNKMKDAPAADPHAQHHREPQ